MKKFFAANCPSIKCQLFFCILLFFQLLTVNCYAQNVFTLTPDRMPQSVNRAFVYYMDETNTLTINNILEKGDFKPSKAEVPNLNVFYGTSWSLAKFTCKEKGEYYLSLEPSGYYETSLFQKKNNGNWTEEKQGEDFPISGKRFSTNHLIYKLELEPNDTITVLLRIQEEMPTQLILKAGIIQSFIEPFHLNDFFYCLVLGIVLTMMLYNFYLFASQKQRLYLIYSIYALFSVLFVVQTSGNNRHLPFFIKNIIEMCRCLPPAMLAINALFFSLELFKNNLPKWLTRTMWIVMFVAVICIGLAFAGYSRESFLLLQPVALAYVTLTFTTGIIALKRKLSSAVFYMLGFGTYSLFFLVFLMSVFGAIPFSENSFKIVSAGLTIEVIMLSFALGDKMKASIVAKEKAQAESLEQSRENERLVREQNITLEQKVNERTKQLSEANEELNQQNEEISAQRDEIESQKHLVDEKHKEITDSINYAERIQRSFLASNEILNKNLKEHFVFFKPKDVVSGDFYWGQNLSNGNFILATADSTGHGVPGAIMSILNISSLEKAIESGLNNPSKILNATRKTIIERLKKDGSAEGGKDGMDASLICFDLTNNKFNYAAANNPIWIIRSNKLIELVPDKMPVGKHERDSVLFTEHEFMLQKGDMIYALTDGFPDQFGGPIGKKFKHKQLKELLISIAGKTMEAQQQELKTVFENWKGKLEQVDDVCVIGIKI